MKRRIPTAVAIVCGLVTLLGYFSPGLQIHLVFVRWAAVLGAVAMILGILNLVGVHLRRVMNQDRDWPYSLALIMSALIVILIALIEGQGPSGAVLNWVFHSVLAPLEAAAASLLVFFLVAAAFRAMRLQPSLTTFVFVITIVLVLLSALALPGDLGQILGTMRVWLVHIFATAGARGMLLGVALGIVATGVRVLLGIDRPHSERES